MQDSYPLNLDTLSMSFKEVSPQEKNFFASGFVYSLYYLIITKRFLLDWRLLGFLLASINTLYK